jgi:hypothetical protein
VNVLPRKNTVLVASVAIVKTLLNMKAFEKRQLQIPKRRILLLFSHGSTTPKQSMQQAASVRSQHVLKNIASALKEGLFAGITASALGARTSLALEA